MTSEIAIVAAASDLTLVIDDQGLIEELHLGNEQMPLTGTNHWIGRHWNEVVTSESGVKVDELIAEAREGKTVRWRHINYPSTQTADIPVLSSTAMLEDGRLIAFGRDLRSMASLQQRLVEAHQAMERDYLRMRHMETRYRLLFELASEAVLIVDTANQRVMEANPAASKILGITTKRMIGKPFSECLPEAQRSVIDDLLMGVRGSGQADTRRVVVDQGKTDVIVSASLFRQETGTLFLVRLTPTGIQDPAQNFSPDRPIMLNVLEHSPDAFVVTDGNGKVLTCNRAFVEMVQLSKTEQAIGRNLSDWLGRSDVDLSVLIANIQQRGAVRLFATLLHGTNGADLQVEISGVSVQSSPVPCLGFSIRDVGQRLGGERPALQQLPRSADQLVELVGRLPLHEIVSETADLIEKLCIEAALRLTRDNRASAAEMLGLSRQSLYVKLRRYNIGEITDRSKK